MKLFCLLALMSLPQAAAGQPHEIFFDPGKSNVEILVKATGHDFGGTLTKYEAVATVDDHLTPVTGRFIWDFKDLKTGNGKRDRTMLQWLSPNLTKGSFTFEHWRETEDGATIVEGTMNIHGVKRKLRFPLTLRRSGNEITATGQATIDHTHFKLPIITFLKFFKVDPKVRVKFVMKGTVR